MARSPQPTLYIPHGGGPCFFMDDPRGIWTEMGTFLRELPRILPQRPDAILLCSGHWETNGFAFTTSARPSLLYDYYNFPPHTYEIQYPAPGDPELAARAAGLLKADGFATAFDAQRGYDHGVFIPMKVAFPEADIPIVEMSIDQSYDPELHLAAGRALAPLRDENVLIIGSGMSFHNLPAYRHPDVLGPSLLFDRWLTDAATADAPKRADLLAHWEAAPMARYAHPREDHLIPLMVAAGAAAGKGRSIFNGPALSTMVSGYRFD